MAKFFFRRGFTSWPRAARGASFSSGQARACLCLTQGRCQTLRSVSSTDEPIYHEPAPPIPPFPFPYKQSSLHGSSFMTREVLIQRSGGYPTDDEAPTSVKIIALVLLTTWKWTYGYLKGSRNSHKVERWAVQSISVLCSSETYFWYISDSTWNYREKEFKAECRNCDATSFFRL